MRIGLMIAVAISLLLGSSLDSNAEGRKLLSSEYEKIKGTVPFKCGCEWFPYPEYADRKGWEDLLGDSAAKLVRAGEKYLGYSWQVVPATAYLEYERTGERGVMETPLKENRVALNTLMLAELAEGQGRFIDDIVNGVWQLSQMPSWVLSAHQPRQASKRSLPDIRYSLIDLVSCAVGAQVSVVWHFFHEEFDRIDPSISYLVETSLRQKILDPYLDSSKYESNWWLGFRLKPGMVVNNWNPWCNSDVILCWLLVEDDQDRLTQAVEQSIRSVDMFIDYVKPDGACEEGPAYWGHAAGKLYDYLQILHDASNGALNVFADKQIRAMGEYISRSYVGDGWVVNFADASARLSFPPALIYNYGLATSSEEMTDFAIYNLADDSKKSFTRPAPVIWNDVYRSLESLRTLARMTHAVDSLNTRCTDEASYSGCKQSLRSHVPQFVWYPLTEFCYMRNADGWFLASKGGHNNESHNHNDVGTFTLYIDNIPVFADAGVGTYTKQTFSEDRYSIWSMQSDWHNLPEINGTSQIYGSEFRSASVSASGRKGRSSFSLDIANAYGECAACKSWNRSLVLTDSELLVTDTYSLSKRILPDVERFLVQGDVLLPGDSCDGRLLKDGEIVIINGGVKVSLKYPKTLKPSVQVKNLDDPRLSGVWGDSLRRISLTAPADAPLSGKYVFAVRRL
ncbi:MAG: heparinase II/III family protein [Candidatus Cryptobacteroides sp.]